MGILSRLFRRDPVSPASAALQDGVYYDLTNPLLVDLLRGGLGTASGASVNADSVLRIATCFRCVVILAESVAQLPLNLMRTGPNGAKDKALDHPLHGVLHERPNQWQTAFEFIRMMQIHVLLRGNAYAIKVVSPRTRQTIGLVPVHPDRMEVKQAADLSLTYRYTPGDGNPVREFAQTDVLHLRDISTNGYLGLSRVALMREAAGLAMRTEEFGARVFQAGVRPGAILKHPGRLSPDAQGRLQKSLEAFAGAQNAHKSMVLEEGMGIESIGFDADDMQYLQTRSFQRSEIAMFFGVPPHLIGDTEKATSWGTGIEQQNIGFLTFTLGPILKAWEQAITRDCLTPTEARTLYPHFVTGGFMRATAKDRGEYYAKALGSGGSPAWMTPNEIRALEDMNPIKGGDALPVPSQSAPAGSPAP